MAERMREKKKEEMRSNKLVVHEHHHSVPVVYYLSRNGQLQHPHFMEVPLSSPQADRLFLTDVINRLSVLRGKSMPAMYSWSCKRSYKNGFVWHDLSDKDFIYPAHGQDEYVLKGSELLPDDNINEDTPPPEKPQQGRRRRNQSCSSIDANHLREYSVYQASTADSAAADASTQTDDARRRPPPERDEIEVSISPPPSDSSPETLETLMEVDRRRRRGEAVKGSTKVGGRSSVLMQLISCGSVSCGAGQGHMGMGLVSQYKARVPRAKLEEKEYFSGSILADSKKEKFPTLKRSTSYNAADR